MSTTAIHVKYVDNELYIVATPSNQVESVELFHYKSGFKDPMDVTIVPQHVLPPGKYSLSLVGINWGGPTGFDVSLTTNGVSTPIPPPAPGTTTVGVVWSPTVAITV